MNMEKCDIFSLGMIILKAFSKIKENKLYEMQLNVYRRHEAEVGTKTSKVVNMYVKNAYFVDILNKMLTGSQHFVFLAMVSL